MPKRKNTTEDKLLILNKKLKRLERKVLRGKRKQIVSSSSSSSTSSSLTGSSSTSRASSPCSRRSPTDDFYKEDDMEPPASSPPAAQIPPAAPSPPPAPAGPAAASSAAIGAPPAPQIEEPLLLDEAILQILGDDPSLTKVFGKDVQKDIAVRFEHVSTNGLSRELRKDLLLKYPIPGNCTRIDAPTMNPEIKAAVSEVVLKRLKAMEIKQKQLAAAITCLSQAITTLLSQRDTDSALLQLLMDATRMMCDSQYNESLTRRGFILSAVKKEMREQLKDTKIDKFLFGDNLAETLRVAKAINKSGAELKSVAVKKPAAKASTSTEKNLPLNWKNPPSQRRPARNQRNPGPAPRSQPASSSRASQQTMKRNHQ